MLFHSPATKSLVNLQFYNIKSHEKIQELSVYEREVENLIKLILRQDYGSGSNVSHVTKMGHHAVVTATAESESTGTVVVTFEELWKRKRKL
ncbi:hypothetical protein VNO78_08340 [Psophocarpus tetragonolobus]|uniref:Uncharacterized protein n=1 Tax=Psophocarpus tetragonolobus TaxID=3891 RepID=A0AAN9SVX5_PSOTE